MSIEPRGCDYCRGSISPSDFDKGRAVVLLGKTYRPACLTGALERSRMRRRAGGGGDSEPGHPPSRPA